MAGRITLNPPDNKNRPPNTGDGTEFGDNWKTVVDNLNTMLTELFGGTGTIAGAKTYSGTQTFNAAITVNAAATFQAGATGTATMGPSGNITKTAGPVGSSATNTTQTLVSYTLPANTLDTVGRMLEIAAWGTVANNAAPKTIALNVGGAFVTTGTQTGAQYAWQLQAMTIKQTANAQNNFFSGMASGGIVTQKSQTDTSVDTGTIGITVTCADASAAQSNVLLMGFAVEYFE